MRINVKNTPELSQLPIAATAKSAAYDVIAISEPEIVGEKNGDYWKRIDYIQYHTALYTAPQKDEYLKNYHILIHPRSSVSKYNLLLANGIGLVDTDYRGEMLVRYKYIWQPEDMFSAGNLISKDDEKTIIQKCLLGIPNIERIYKKGDRIAQLVIEPTTEAEWVRVEDLDKTERGEGGFGSTDKNVIQIKDPMLKGETLKIVGGISNITKDKEPPKKEYESHVDLIEQWKKNGGLSNHPSSYETLVKEREKSIPSSK